MRYVVLLVLGMVLLVVGAQGAIRLLADHNNSGVLSWVPGFAAQLIVYLVMTVVGVALAAIGGPKVKPQD